MIIGFWKGDKIGQLILEKYSKAKVLEVKKLSKSDRGAGGFGSSNVASSKVFIILLIKDYSVITVGGGG